MFIIVILFGVQFYLNKLNRLFKKQNNEQLEHVLVNYSSTFPHNDCLSSSL